MSSANPNSNIAPAPHLIPLGVKHSLLIFGVGACPLMIDISRF